MKTAKTKEHGGAAFHEATTPATTTEARAMLLAFASVGATHFDVTLKDEQSGKTSFDKGRTLNGLTISLTSLLYRAERDSQDIIVRPRGKNETDLIQLDDLTAESVQRVRAFAFAIIETSRGNFQAWLCVTGADETTARRLRATTGADLHASGAVRLGGTTNHKKEYAPNFPTVRLVESQLSRTTTAAELHANGLLIETMSETTTMPPRVPCPHRFQSQTYPDYGRCLKDAPEKQRGEGKDISRADWQFSLIAADRGFTADEITAKLMNVSEKAKTDGIKYAERTARRAVENVSRRKTGQ
jgi:hypothetical protein